MTSKELKQQAEAFKTLSNKLFEAAKAFEIVEKFGLKFKGTPAPVKKQPTKKKNKSLNADRNGAKILIKELAEGNEALKNLTETLNKGKK